VTTEVLAPLNKSLWKTPVKLRWSVSPYKNKHQDMGLVKLVSSFLKVTPPGDSLVKMLETSYYVLKPNTCIS